MLMTASLPPQGSDYVGPITDTSRWVGFEPRADDIFVCTPPKCGTTWTQAICAMLIFGRADHGQQPGVLSPWLDAQFAPVDVVLEQLEAQAHRRYIKTHTPFDGIPYSLSCTYLVVIRDPRDVFFSGTNHRDNMTDQELANSAFPSGPNAFRDWLTNVREPGGWDVQSLDSLCHFMTTYWSYRELPNVHVFHYSDMKRDLRGAISSMAAAVDIEISAAQLDAYTEAATFENMKANADQFAPEAGTGMWKAETDFFANGSSRQWQDRLSAEDLAAFDARLAELLPADQAEWMLNGAG